MKIFTPAGAAVAPRALPRLTRAAIKVRAEPEKVSEPAPVAEKEEVPLKFASEETVEAGKK